MLRIVRAVWPSKDQWAAAVRGMRNPLDSWPKSDSEFDDQAKLGEKDLGLADRLCAGGSEHRKFLRQLPVSLEINAPISWWWQMDQYRHCVADPVEDAMADLLDYEFTLDDFAFGDSVTEGIAVPPGQYIVNALNLYREAYEEWEDEDTADAIWQLLPQSYLVTRMWVGNYETVRQICEDTEMLRGEWDEFAEFIRDNAPYADELIFGVFEDD